MPVIHSKDLPRVTLREGISGAFVHSDQLTTGYITLEPGAHLPSHAHPHEQWSHLIEGELEFVLDGESFHLTCGMSVYIPSEAIHSATAITRCKVIDTFCPVREDYRVLTPNLG